MTFRLSISSAKQYIYSIIMSQETLRNLQIHRVGNSPLFHVIVENIHRIVKGYQQNHQRVSAKSSKGVCEFVEGHQHSRKCQRHPQHCMKW